MSEQAPEPQEPQRPEWLPDKFKSPEEMARSYSEAEQRLLSMQQQIEDERGQFQQALQNMEAMQQQTQQQRWDPNGDPLIQHFQRAVDEGDAQAMLSIQLELNRQIARQEMQGAMQEMGGRLDRSSESDRETAITLATERVSRNYPDWDSLAPRIGEFLQARPHWIPENSSVDAFERTLTEAASVLLAQDTIQQRSADEADRVAKLSQQGLTGQSAGVRNPEADQAEWEKIKATPLGGYSELFRRS
jgi:hypothetical protein